jgi:hypothetical protein
MIIGFLYHRDLGIKRVELLYFLTIFFGGFSLKQFIKEIKRGS